MRCKTTYTGFALVFLIFSVFSCDQKENFPDTESEQSRLSKVAYAGVRSSNYGIKPFPGCEEWKTAIAPLGTDWHKEFLEIAPALIVVFQINYSFDENGDRIKHYYVSESVGLATGFLIAALHHAGLATLTHTPSPMNFLNTVLERPRNERPFVLMPVGYPAEDALVPEITKKPLDEIAVWK